MKFFYLLLACIITVIILIISFANYNACSMRIFFDNYNTPLTLPFMFMAFLGIIVGASITLFMKEHQGEEHEDENKDDNF